MYWTQSGSLIQRANLDGSGLEEIPATGVNFPAGITYAFTLIATRYVAPTGSDTGNDCLDPLTPSATLAYAVQQADPGDVIDLAAGTYAAPGVLIEKNVHIRGQGVVVQ